MDHQHFLPSISPPRRFEPQRHRHDRSPLRSTHWEGIDRHEIGPSIPRRVLTSQSCRKLEIPYQLHDGFTRNEQIVIENALQIVANRLFKPEVLENMYRICGRTGYFLAPGLWERSNLSKHSTHHGKEFLLQYQLMCLRTKGEIGGFPCINIYPIFQRSEVVARGIFACITCISHQSTFSIDGEFRVKLNRYHLQSSRRNSLDVLEWAGIIVHEMLHNLGHNHDDLDYTDRWQMNIFKECFIHNGNYSP